MKLKDLRADEPAGFHVMSWLYDRGYGPEPCHPEDKIIEEMFYVVAEWRDGYRAAHRFEYKDRSYAEAAVDSLVTDDGWEEHRPCYGSEAYVRMGTEADDAYWERREEGW